MQVNWTTVLQLLVAAAIPLAVVGISHWATVRRDYANERRKLRIEYLIDVYRRLESSSNRPQSTEVWAKFESAIADIQLLGSAHQASLARQFSREMADSGGSSLDELVADLRISLRKELSLEPIQGNPIYLRYVDDSQGLEASVRSGSKQRPPKTR